MATGTTGGLLAPKTMKTSNGLVDITQQTLNDKSLVQNQLATISSQDSSLNQLARTDANKAVNSRGLLNSSLAVGAAQNAVLKNALPVAQQDAQSYYNTDAANANFANSANQTAAQLAQQQRAAQLQADTQTSIANEANKTNLALADKDAATKTALAQLDAATKTALADKDAATKTALAQLDAQTKTTLQTLDGQQKADLQNTIGKNQQLLQSNVSASNLATQYMTNLANISTNDKLDGPAKQQAIDNQTTALNQQLQVISDISGLDLGKYFVKSPSA